jgi:hypothetical protein
VWGCGLLICLKNRQQHSESDCEQFFRRSHHSLSLRRNGTPQSSARCSPLSDSCPGRIGDPSIRPSHVSSTGRRALHNGCVPLDSEPANSPQTQTRSETTRTKTRTGKLGMMRESRWLRPEMVRVHGLARLDGPPIQRQADTQLETLKKGGGIVPLMRYEWEHIISPTVR